MVSRTDLVGVQLFQEQESAPGFVHPAGLHKQRENGGVWDADVMLSAVKSN